MENKHYPELTDFPIEETSYGFNKISGFGVYRIDPETREVTHGWPDLEGVTEKEYQGWVQHVRSAGYEFPGETL